MLAQPGLINVDFADLCAVTKGRHSQNYFATVQAEGAERCERLLKSLFAHPLLENGILDNADAL
jgi:cell division GTPase FtsZ